jgi:hypothetical protein
MSNGSSRRITTEPIDPQPFSPKIREPEQMTELEATKLQVFALRHQLLQQQVQANLAERAALIQQIVTEHPGHRWDEATGKLMRETVV